MVMGALGQRENDNGRGTTRLGVDEAPLVQRQAVGVIATSLAIAVVLTAIACVI